MSTGEEYFEGYGNSENGNFKDHQVIFNNLQTEEFGEENGENNKVSKNVDMGSSSKFEIDKGNSEKECEDIPAMKEVENEPSSPSENNEGKSSVQAADQEFPLSPSMDDKTMTVTNFSNAESINASNFDVDNENNDIIPTSIFQDRQVDISEVLLSQVSSQVDECISRNNNMDEKSIDIDDMAEKKPSMIGNERESGIRVEEELKSEREEYKILSDEGEEEELQFEDLALSPTVTVKMSPKFEKKSLRYSEEEMKKATVEKPKEEEKSNAEVIVFQVQGQRFKKKGTVRRIWNLKPEVQKSHECKENDGIIEEDVDRMMKVAGMESTEEDQGEEGTDEEKEVYATPHESVEGAPGVVEVLKNFLGGIDNEYEEGDVKISNNEDEIILDEIENEILGDEIMMSELEGEDSLDISEEGKYYCFSESCGSGPWDDEHEFVKHMLKCHPEERSKFTLAQISRFENGENVQAKKLGMGKEEEGGGLGRAGQEETGDSSDIGGSSYDFLTEDEENDEEMSEGKGDEELLGSKILSLDNVDDITTQKEEESNDDSQGENQGRPETKEGQTMEVNDATEAHLQDHEEDFDIIYCDDEDLEVHDLDDEFDDQMEQDHKQGMNRKIKTSKLYRLTTSLANEEKKVASENTMNTYPKIELFHVTNQKTTRSQEDKRFIMPKELGKIFEKRSLKSPSMISHANQKGLSEEDNLVIEKMKELRRSVANEADQEVRHLHEKNVKSQPEGVVDMQQMDPKSTEASQDDRQESKSSLIDEGKALEKPRSFFGIQEDQSIDFNQRSEVFDDNDGTLVTLDEIMKTEEFEEDRLTTTEEEKESMKSSTRKKSQGSKNFTNLVDKGKDEYLSASYPEAMEHSEEEGSLHEIMEFGDFGGDDFDNMALFGDGCNPHEDKSIFVEEEDTNLYSSLQGLERTDKDRAKAFVGITKDHLDRKVQRPSTPNDGEVIKHTIDIRNLHYDGKNTSYEFLGDEFVLPEDDESDDEVNPEIEKLRPRIDVGKKKQISTLELLQRKKDIDESSDDDGDSETSEIDLSKFIEEEENGIINKKNKTDEFGHMRPTLDQPLQPQPKKDREARNGTPMKLKSKKKRKKRRKKKGKKKVVPEEGGEKQNPRRRKKKRKRRKSRKDVSLTDEEPEVISFSEEDVNLEQQQQQQQKQYEGNINSSLVPIKMVKSTPSVARDQSMEPERDYQTFPSDDKQRRIDLERFLEEAKKKLDDPTHRRSETYSTGKIMKRTPLVSGTDKTREEIIAMIYRRGKDEENPTPQRRIGRGYSRDNRKFMKETPQVSARKEFRRSSESDDVISATDDDELSSRDTQGEDQQQKMIVQQPRTIRKKVKRRRRSTKKKKKMVDNYLSTSPSRSPRELVTRLQSRKISRMEKIQAGSAGKNILLDEEEGIFQTSKTNLKHLKEITSSRNNVLKRSASEPSIITTISRKMEQQKTLDQQQRELFEEEISDSIEIEEEEFLFESGEEYDMDLLEDGLDDTQARISRSLSQKSKKNVKWMEEKALLMNALEQHREENMELRKRLELLESRLNNSDNTLEDDERESVSRRIDGSMSDFSETTRNMRSMQSMVPTRKLENLIRGGTLTFHNCTINF